MSEIIDQVFKLYDDNRKQTMKKYRSNLDDMEKRSRCLFFIGENLQSIDSKIGLNLCTITNEVFLDLTQAIYHGAQSQYRTAYQSLRSALELTLAVIFFVDHPVELIKWQHDKFDFQFSLSKDILSSEYAQALGTNIDPKYQEVANLYRTLSQYVHGKYDYLTAGSESIFQFNAEQVKRLIDIFDITFKAIIHLYTYRFESLVKEASTKYQFLENFIK